MKVVELTKGKTALVDDEDFAFVSQFKWCAINAGAQTRIGKSRVLMHRLLLNPEPSQCIDHRNRDRLDNRRSNLRLATHAENAKNKKGWSAGFKGVYDVRKFRGYQPASRASGKPLRYFRARIVSDGRSYSLGSHYTAEEAARAYDRKALELHGEFACLNFPNQKISS